MTWRPTRFDKYVCPTPIAPVMIGMMTMIPTKIRSACMLGHGAPDMCRRRAGAGTEQRVVEDLPDHERVHNTEPAEMTIATPTIDTLRRYGRKMATTRLTVVPEIGRLSSSEIGRRK